MDYLQYRVGVLNGTFYREVLNLIINGLPSISLLKAQMLYLL